MSKNKMAPKPNDVGGKYNGSAYVKPRRMKPKNMTKETSDSFTDGHVKKTKK
jgi:hypothetical protein